MREIEFRGKCLKTNKWVFGDLITPSLKTVQYFIGNSYKDHKR